MRILCAAILLAGVVAVLFTWVFPWLEPRLPFNEVTVSLLGPPGGALRRSATGRDARGRRLLFPREQTPAEHPRCR